MCELGPFLQTEYSVFDEVCYVTLDILWQSEEIEVWRFDVKLDKKSAMSLIESTNASFI